MEQTILDAIRRSVESEPFAQALNMKLVALERGRSLVEMIYEPTSMGNLFNRAHGGAIFALIDEAFETVCQADGTVTVALNVNVTYVSSPEDGARLQAEAREVNRTKRTALYDIKVRDQKGQLIATCNALAYRTGRPLPFL